MKISKNFIKRSYTDSGAITSENIAYDETRSISEESNAVTNDNITLTSGIFISSAGTIDSNGIYVYTGILSGKPYYVNGNHRLIWSSSNYRWELQTITPNSILYYNDTTTDLSKPYYNQNWQVDNGVSPAPSLSNTDHTGTIKEIDYIIDDDNESIDGSDTPMSDPHRELPTRAYVDSTISNSANWTKTGTQLEPSDPLVESILIDNNHNGYNIITLENINTGNGAGGVFEAHKSNTAYQDNIYMGIYSDNFWLSDIAGKGVVFTDQDLVIGTVDNTKNINFLVGNSYTAPVVVGHLNQNGLYLDTIMTTSVHPASYHNLFVDASNGLIYASSTGTTGNTPQTDKVVVDSTMVTNKTFTLTQTYNVDRQIYVYQNGLLLEDGYEWTISSNDITFTEVETVLTINDRIVIKYYY